MLYYFYVLFLRLNFENFESRMLLILIELGVYVIFIDRCSSKVELGSGEELNVYFIVFND